MEIEHLVDLAKITLGQTWHIQCDTMSQPKLHVLNVGFNPLQPFSLSHEAPAPSPKISAFAADSFLWLGLADIPLLLSFSFSFLARYPLPQVLLVPPFAPFSLDAS